MEDRSFARFFAGPFFTSALQRAKSLSRMPMVRWAVNLIVLFFCAAYLYRHFPDILNNLQGIRLRAGWLVLAVVLTWTINALGGAAWLLMLRAVDPAVDTFGGIRAHLKSVVIRYVPGYIWQFVGKAYLSTGLGIALRAVNVLIPFEQMELIGLGAAAALVLLPSARVAEWNLSAPVQWVLSVCGMLLALGIFSAPWLGRKIFTAALPAGTAFRPRFLLFSGLLIFFSWLLHGLGLWMTSAAFGVIPSGALPFLSFAFSLSLVSGILVLPVPNGLGVREGIMVFLLSHIMPQPMALLVAAVSRLELVTGDFVLFGVSSLIHRVRLASMKGKPVEGE